MALASSFMDWRVWTKPSPKWSHWLVTKQSAGAWISSTCNYSVVIKNTCHGEKALEKEVSSFVSNSHSLLFAKKKPFLPSSRWLLWDSPGFNCWQKEQAPPDLRPPPWPRFKIKFSGLLEGKFLQLMQQIGLESQADALAVRWWEHEAEQRTPAAPWALRSGTWCRRSWDLWRTKAQFQTERECEINPREP